MRLAEFPSSTAGEFYFFIYFFFFCFANLETLALLSTGGECPFEMACLKVLENVELKA
jgi:hypothetical protein